MIRSVSYSPFSITLSVENSDLESKSIDKLTCLKLDPAQLHIRERKEAAFPRASEYMTAAASIVILIPQLR